MYVVYLVDNQDAVICNEHLLVYNNRLIKCMFYLTKNLGKSVLIELCLQ